MAITFSCGHCGKSLTTTDDKAGRKAKCPGCGEVVSVPGLESDTDLDGPDIDDADAGGDFDNLPAAPARERDTGSKTCPMCGAENPRRAKTCSACGEKFEDQPEKDGPRSTRIIDPGEVISASWTIYKNELGLVLGSVIVVMIIGVMAGIPAQVVSTIANAQQAQGQDATALWGLYTLLLIPSNLVGIFMNIGQAKVLYKVARGKETSIGEIFTGGPHFLKALGATIVFSIMLVIGAILLCVPAVIVLLMFWPFIYVLVDENPDGIDCLWRAKEITQGNWGSAFVIFLAGVGLYILGLMMLCIGVIFTLPLAYLMFAVAYCHMTGQRTAE